MIILEIDPPYLVTLHGCRTNGSPCDVRYVVEWLNETRIQIVFVVIRVGGGGDTSRLSYSITIRRARMGFSA